MSHLHCGKRWRIVAEKVTLYIKIWLISFEHASVLTLSQRTNFRLFQTGRVADDNFKFDRNGRKFSKRVENTAGKGEIARYEQFLLFPQCFQKTFNADT